MKKVTLQFSRFRSHLRSNPGQSMVEFAIALPILLLLVFGIIEFGRILQAWLAIENGARFGVRYAVTGNYDSQYCTAAVTALTDDLGLTAAEETDGSADCVIEDAIGNQVDDISVPLQDFARLLTIRDVSLQGATGIAYNLDDPVSGNYEDFLTAAFTTLSDGLFHQDHRGNPSQPGFFNVTTCSNRVIQDEGVLFGLQPNNFFFSPIPGGGNPNDFLFPQHCEEVEIGSWNLVRAVDDAGGPGDRVRVTLTYRHNLITPFLSTWWPTMRLTAMREGIVEKFRTSRVTGLTGGMAFLPTWTFTPPPATMTPTETLTPTATSTTTATPTPTPDCGLFVNDTEAQTGNAGEQLTIQNGGNAVEAYLRNNDSNYSVWLSAASLNYNSGWHSEFEEPMTGHIFDYYAWESNANKLYDPANQITYPISHIMPTPNYRVYPGQSGWFKWVYSTPFTFWQTPNFRQYPFNANPTLALSVTPPAPNQAQMYYWPSDFNAGLVYKIGFEEETARTCSMSMTGREGPNITLQYSTSSPISGAFWIRAIIDGTDPAGTEFVYFYVYDSNGYLVSWSSDNASQYCIFGGSCNSRTPWVNTWLQGSVNAGLIQDGDYTLVVLARNLDNRKKSSVIVDHFSITAPTPTTTSTITRTVTPTITKTTTNTPSPTITRTPTSTRTITLTPTITNTPTVTRTRTVTRTPTVTRTRTNTPTITQTRTITRTPTITLTFTVTNTRTNTPTSTNTPTRTNTPTVTNTYTPTITYTVTLTRTITLTFTITPTRTLTPTRTSTRTITSTPTSTTTLTPTITRTPTLTPTKTLTPTRTQIVICQTPEEYGGCKTKTPTVTPHP